MFKKRLHLTTILVVAITLCSCTGGTKPLSNEPTNVQAKSGRYAIQWEGYLAGYTDELLTLHLAFVDVLETAAQAPAPQFNALTLLTDRGEIAAQTSPRTLSPPGTNYQFFSLSVRLQNLEAGVYNFQRVRFIDEAKQSRELVVGNWRIEILVGTTPPDFKELGSSVSTSRFNILETRLQNQHTQPVIVAGLAFTLPTTVVTTTMILAETQIVSVGQAAGNAQPGLQIVTASEPVTQVILLPLATEDFTFRFSTNQQDAFVALRPMLVYHTEEDATRRYFGLPTQVYSPSFAGAQLTEYLQQLPTDAYYALGI